MRARRKPMTWSAKRLFKHASRISGNESINKYSAALFFTPDRIHVYRTMNDVRTSPYMHHDFPFITVTLFLFFFFFFFSRYWSSNTIFFILASANTFYDDYSDWTFLKFEMEINLGINYTRDTYQSKGGKKEITSNRAIKCIELKFG